MEKARVWENVIEEGFLLVCLQAYKYDIGVTIQAFTMSANVENSNVIRTMCTIKVSSTSGIKWGSTAELCFLL